MILSNIVKKVLLVSGLILASYTIHRYAIKQYPESLAFFKNKTLPQLSSADQLSDDQSQEPQSQRLQLDIDQLIDEQHQEALRDYREHQNRETPWYKGSAISKQDDETSFVKRSDSSGSVANSVVSIDRPQNILDDYSAPPHGDGLYPYENMAYQDPAVWPSKSIHMSQNKYNGPANAEQQAEQQYEPASNWIDSKARPDVSGTRGKNHAFKTQSSNRESMPKLGKQLDIPLDEGLSEQPDAQPDPKSSSVLPGWAQPIIDLGISSLGDKAFKKVKEYFQRASTNKEDYALASKEKKVDQPKDVPKKVDQQEDSSKEEKQEERQDKAKETAYTSDIPFVKKDEESGSEGSPAEPADPTAQPSTPSSQPADLPVDPVPQSSLPEKKELRLSDLQVKLPTTAKVIPASAPVELLEELAAEPVAILPDAQGHGAVPLPSEVSQTPKIVRKELKATQTLNDDKKLLPQPSFSTLLEQSPSLELAELPVDSVKPSSLSGKKVSSLEGLQAKLPTTAKVIPASARRELLEELAAEPVAILPDAQGHGAVPLISEVPKKQRRELGATRTLGSEATSLPQPSPELRKQLPSQSPSIQDLYRDAIDLVDRELESRPLVAPQAILVDSILPAAGQTEGSSLPASDQSLIDQAEESSASIVDQGLPVTEEAKAKELSAESTKGASKALVAKTKRSKFSMGQPSSGLQLGASSGVVASGILSQMFSQWRHIEPLLPKGSSISPELMTQSGSSSWLPNWSAKLARNFKSPAWVVSKSAYALSKGIQLAQVLAIVYPQFFAKSLPAESAITAQGSTLEVESIRELLPIGKGMESVSILTPSSSSPRISLPASGQSQIEFLAQVGQWLQATKVPRVIAP